jgi:hypothetical protein
MQTIFTFTNLCSVMVFFFFLIGCCIQLLSAELEARASFQSNAELEARASFQSNHTVHILSTGPYELMEMIGVKYKKVDELKFNYMVFGESGKAD